MSTLYDAMFNNYIPIFTNATFINVSKKQTPMLIEMHVQKVDTKDALSKT